jgi:XRE family transcriptional regulator, aerobic/anaerobic benzoate catabolism transcriptional regulator
MSSTILHKTELRPAPAPAEDDAAIDEKNPFLVALGDRARALRARRGMTRKAVALAADVSEHILTGVAHDPGVTRAPR